MTVWHVADVAQFLGVPETSVYKYAKEKKLPAMKIGKHWMFNKEAIEQLLIRSGEKWYSTVELLDSNLNKPKGGESHGMVRNTKQRGSQSSNKTSKIKSPIRGDGVRH